MWVAFGSRTEGTSIFKEMVQNADDAGATEVCFCLDYRQHASGRLAYQKLASFQGEREWFHTRKSRYVLTLASTKAHRC